MAELGETTDPRGLIPGDASEIRKSTENLTTYASTLVRIGEGLQRLDTGGWTGDAADRFQEYFDGEPGRWVTCGDAFHSAATAINRYADTLEWAQGEAQRAIELWQGSQQATRQARAQYEQASQQAAEQAAASGAAPPAMPPFDDPGEPKRREARAVLDNARTQLASAGDQATSVVDEAQQHAPEEPSLIGEVVGGVGDAVSGAVGNIAHFGMTAAADVVDFTTNAAGVVVEGAGWVAGKTVDGVGNAIGATLDAVGLDDAGDSVESTTGAAATTVASATRTAGNAAWDWGDERADDIRDAAADVADSLGAENPPSHTAEFEPPEPNYIVVDEDRYPESAQHIEEAQAGTIWQGDTAQPGQPLPDEVTVDKANADINRREALQGIPGRGGERLDRDEYPPAMFAEGGEGSSVKYIPSSDNRGSGASIGSQVRAQGLERGDKATIVVG